MSLANGFAVYATLIGAAIIAVVVFELIHEREIRARFEDLRALEDRHLQRQSCAHDFLPGSCMRAAEQPFPTWTYKEKPTAVDRPTLAGKARVGRGGNAHQRRIERRKQRP